MTGARTFLARLARDCAGATIVEFAILAPAVIGLMLGVFQIGMAMQSYNAIRSVTAEAARYATVEYQKGEEPNNAAIRTQTIAIADGPPYLLDPDELTVTVVDAANQRVNGAREMTITVSYDVPSVLPLFEWTSPTVTQTRPIFVLE